MNLNEGHWQIFNNTGEDDDEIKCNEGLQWREVMVKVNLEAKTCLLKFQKPKTLHLIIN